MIKKDNGQVSFYGHIYEAVIPRDHFLKKLSQAVDFSFVNEVCEALYCEDFGRPGYTPLLMFKITFLEFLYELSDRQVCEDLQVNLAYKWFVGMDVCEASPDATSLTKFRNRLGAERFKELFNQIVKQAREQKLITDRLQIIDSTHIEARVDLFRLKEEFKRDDDDTHYVDRHSPDTDARFGKKGEKKAFYGFKAHAAVDADSELFVAVEVSPGNAPDGAYFVPLLYGNPDAVTADKAYDWGENHKHCHQQKIHDAIIRKDNRPYAFVMNLAYESEQRKRPVIERRFADPKKYHGMRACRYWGLWRTKIQVLMTMLVCNCKRMVKLCFQKNENAPAVA